MRETMRRPSDVICLILCIALCITFPQSPVLGEKCEKITLFYRFNLPSIVAILEEGKTFSRVNLEGLPKISFPGKPRLPVKPLRILLPYATAIKKIHVESSQCRKLHLTYPIEIGGQTFCLSKGFSVRQNFSCEVQGIYPNTTYSKIGIQYWRGYSILHINLYPVQYIGYNKTILFHQSFKVVIELKKSKPSPLYRGDGKDKIAHMVENPDVLSTYPPKNFSSVYDYVLITTENLINTSGEYTFIDLLNHRREQGLSCTYKTVEAIGKEFDGIDLQEKIRNFIRYAYMEWGTTWILLGGDVEKVPVRYLVDVDGEQEDEKVLASDIYYQCLDGSYNYDGDDLWGEKFDGVGGGLIDLYAEVYLGRAPVDDAEDVSAFVEKILVYESSKWGEDTYLSKVLALGEILWDGPGGLGSGYVERCIDHCEDYNQDTYGIPSSRYTIIRLYEEEMSWNRSHVMNEINRGVGIINHVGHGNTISAMKLSTHDILLLDNDGGYPLLYSQACHAGQFDRVDECFAERWVNAPKSGGVAAIMNTGYGYGSTTDYDGADNRLAREFFDALFSPYERISRVGEANQDSKEDNYWRINEPNMYHACYSTTLFGDPYMEIKGAEDTSAAFSWKPTYPVVGEPINFIDESKGIIAYWEWDFGDGTTSYTRNPTHIFFSEGSYKVTLTVVDIYGFSSTTTRKVQVRINWPPFAIAEPSYYYGTNLTVAFRGNKSWDPDGTIVQYMWNFDDGTLSTKVNPIHRFPSAGVYNVRFTVTDNDGCTNTTFCKIIIEDQSPPTPPSLLSNLTVLPVGVSYAFKAVSIDPENDLIQYGWDWGDESSIEWSDWFTSGEVCTFNHSWSSPGEYSIRVKARDSHQAESEWSVPLKIRVIDMECPTVKFKKPFRAVYIFNRKFIPFPITVVIGDISIEVTATDNGGIDRVIFYVDDKPVAEDLAEPYTWAWRKSTYFPLFGRHHLKVNAFDNAGNVAGEEIIVWRIF